MKLWHFMHILFIYFLRKTNFPHYKDSLKMSYYLNFLSNNMIFYTLATVLCRLFFCSRCSLFPSISYIMSTSLRFQLPKCHLDYFLENQQFTNLIPMNYWRTYPSWYQWCCVCDDVTGKFATAMTSLIDFRLIISRRTFKRDSTEAWRSCWVLATALLQISGKNKLETHV